MKSARAAIPVEVRGAASRSIQERVLVAPAFASARNWFVYVSFREEVDTRFLIDELLARGKQVYVPRTGAGQAMQALAFPGWHEMQPDPYGILVPLADAPSAVQLDICLCPGLAFTRRGDRLGYGQGHYDRFLAQWPQLTVVALAFFGQLVEELPREPTDRRMHWIATEAEMIHVA